ncbi:hypothetical protein ACFL19_00040 [Pseudomonadota bacterium]
MHPLVSRSVKPILVIFGVLLVWWALDHLVRPIPSLNVSEQTQYSPVLGKRFCTKHDLVAIGYTVDRNYKKQIDYIALVKPPGFSGPEVVATGQLPKGSVLEVTAVLKADTWLNNRIEYVVKRLDAKQPLDGKMILGIDEESSRNFGLPETEFVIFNGSCD